ncbi:MAG: geranylgeranylglycerol-phosphate geranylgeranyltransferase [Cyclobacteriaceae bacterium]|nr:geranylgeranylglycerol-phosphate geranylgeranyltransferase [Cyclobacteriaceae bacterium]
MTTARNFSLIGFIKLTRIGNLLIIVFAQYFASFFLVTSAQNWKTYLLDIDLFFLSLSSVLIAASGYIINDYYDVKIDYINKPDRVVVGKVIKRRVVMAAHTIINFCGIGIGYLVSPIFAFINFGSAMLLWLYSNQLKRLVLVGNLAVSVLAGLSIYVVELLYQSHNPLLFIYASFALGYTVIREVVKDVEDVQGDEAFGCKTLPIVYGVRKTKVFLFLFIILFGASLSYLLFNIASPFGLILMTGNIVLLTTLTIVLYQADTKKEFHRLSTVTKIMMMLGILSMIFI